MTYEVPKKSKHYLMTIVFIEIIEKGKLITIKEGGFARLIVMHSRFMRPYAKYDSGHALRKPIFLVSANN